MSIDAKMIAVFGTINLLSVGLTGGLILGAQLLSRPHELAIQQPVPAIYPSANPFPSVPLPTMVPPSLPTVPAIAQAPVMKPQPTALPAESPFLNPVKAGRIMAVLAKLDAVESGVTNPERAIQIFFDPRCPYCHKAFDMLNGKVPIRWIPVPVLDNPGVGDQPSHKLSSAILLATVKGNENGMTFMARAFSNQITPAELNSETAMKEMEASRTSLEEKIQQNLQSFFAVHMADPTKAGAPTILVPRPDGTIGFHIGFNDADAAVIIKEYGAQK